MLSDCSFRMAFLNLVNLVCAVLRFGLCCPQIWPVMSSDLLCAVLRFGLCCSQIWPVLSSDLACAVLRFGLCCPQIWTVLSSDLACAVLIFGLCCPYNNLIKTISLTHLSLICHRLHSIIFNVRSNSIFLSIFYKSFFLFQK